MIGARAPLQERAPSPTAHRERALDIVDSKEVLAMQKDREGGTLPLVAGLDAAEVAARLRLAGRLNDVSHRAMPLTYVPLQETVVFRLS